MNAKSPGRVAMPVVRFVMLILLSSVALATDVRGVLTAPIETDDGWPVVTLEEAEFNRDALNRLTEIIHLGSFGNIHAAVVARDGKLAYEQYFAGDDNVLGWERENVVFTLDEKHDLRSVTKSVTSAVLGAALGSEFDAALSRPILDFFPELVDVAKPGADEITLHEVLTMSAGLKWRQDRRSFPDDNDEDRQYFDSDPLSFVFSCCPVEDPPGEKWVYNSGLLELMGAVVERHTGQSLVDYAHTALFEPLGITDVEWFGSEHWDNENAVSAAWGLRMKARDLTKIGQVFLNEGRWKGRQIPPSAWVERATQRHIETSPTKDYGYGYQWWVTRSKDVANPYTVVSGRGRGQQALFIVPKYGLVVTVFAWYPHIDVVYRLLRDVVAAIQTEP